jgi:hypothetical protein
LLYLLLVHRLGPFIAPTDPVPVGSHGHRHAQTRLPCDERTSWPETELADTGRARSSTRRADVESIHWPRSQSAADSDHELAQTHSGVQACGSSRVRIRPYGVQPRAWPSANTSRARPHGRAIGHGTGAGRVASRASPFTCHFTGRAHSI